MKNVLTACCRVVHAYAALLLATHAYGQASYVNLHTFVTGDGEPCGGVVLGRDGAVYGMTMDGGSNSVGTVYRADLQSLDYTVLHTFTTNGSDGQVPVGAVPGNIGSGGSTLIQGRDGALYGLTFLGGTKGGGTVFKVSTNGTGYQVVYNISTNASGGWPEPCGLIQGLDGALYVTTYATGDDGAVFKVNPDGLSYSLVHGFDHQANHGFYPMASVIQGGDGMLYGTTSQGGASAQGTVFKVGTNGLGFTYIHDFFTASDLARSPSTPLMQGSDGALYGTTSLGGSNDVGVVFKLNTNGTGYTELHDFDNPNGYYHNGRFAGPLVQESNGALCGGMGGVSFYRFGTDGSNYTDFYVPVPNVNADAGDTVYTMGPDGSLYGRGFKLSFALANYAVIYSFKNDGTDGRSPEANLAQGPDNTLYGTTCFGGTNNEGTVFSLNPNGNAYVQLHSFLANGIDGNVPTALLRGRDGALYGTTPIGGTNNVGTVFKINTNGSGYSLLHTFVTNGIDGRNAVGLLQGKDDILYGSTQSGGSNNVGTVFKLNIDSSGYAVLHTFVTNNNDGQHIAMVVQGSDSMLYGTTRRGGNNNAGTVFKLNSNGGAYSPLHAFSTNGVDGQIATEVLQGSDGMLYGTTVNGGSNNVGTVFKLNTNGGAYTLLHTFTSSGADGQVPVGLIQASDGMLYGTTENGGTFNGTIFKLNTDGSGYEVVHDFDLNVNPDDGYLPVAGLWQGNDGALYGTTSRGGTNDPGNGTGVIFRLALNPGGFNSFALLPNKTFQLSIVGAALDYRIDASTNLANWVTLTNVVNNAGTFHFIDPNAGNFPRRFYRLHSSP